MTIGGRTEEGVVTAWEPPRRFAHRDGSPDGSQWMAFEWLIEGRDDGTCVPAGAERRPRRRLGDRVRRPRQGWDMYLHQLAQYLGHFRGRPVAPVWPCSRGRRRRPVWSVLSARSSSTIPRPRAAKVRLTPEGLAPIEGVVDYVSPMALGIRTDDGLYRFIRGFDGSVAVGHHLFSDVDPEEAERLAGLAQPGVRRKLTTWQGGQRRPTPPSRPATAATPR